jgi:hypothetical protein
MKNVISRTKSVSNLTFFSFEHKNNFLRTPSQIFARVICFFNNDQFGLYLLLHEVPFYHSCHKLLSNLSSTLTHDLHLSELLSTF